jgi:hypothetical protein
MEHNIKMDPEEIEYVGVKSIQWFEDGVHLGSFERGNEASGSIKGKLFEQLGDCQRLKEESVL